MALQENISAQSLQEFDLPITVIFIKKAEDWQTRQKIQYAALLGLLREDFFGLNDWKEQINIYSAASTILKPSLTAILPLIPINRKILQKLVIDPELGTVSRYLLSLYGFSEIVTQPQDLLLKDLGSLIGVL